MELATVISNLKTFLEGLSWPSGVEEEKTSLQAVYTCPKYEGVKGFPFGCVFETTTEFSFIDNMTYKAVTLIKVEICVNYDIIELQDDESKREEGLARVRKAWDYIKTQLFLFTTERTMGILLEEEPQAETLYDTATKLYKKVITMRIAESIDK